MGMHFLEKDCSVFHKTRERWGEFSNMHSGFSFDHKGVWIYSSEHLYQALKFPSHPSIQEEVLQQKNPMLAKRIAVSHVAKAREDWMAVRVSLMAWCLLAKTHHYQKRILDVLLQTEDTPIVEKSYKDSFWGAIPQGDFLEGENVLGRLWMSIRERASRLPKVLPRSPGENLFLGEVL